ncbi:polysaccharide deacetylase family protein [Nesterenkonia halobia]|uniref:NodB homology domain-containing protein n=1 Tax=Nesterenkonia halobia TaxID=37922 RepID=A0ABP6R7R6_9MICC
MDPDDIPETFPLHHDQARRERARRRRRSAQVAVAMLALGAVGLGGCALSAAGPEELRQDAGRAVEELRTGLPVPGAPPAPESAEDPAVLHRVPTDDPVVFVTLDDGTHPDQGALDLVQEHDMPVSLFLNEEPVHRHAEYFAQYLARGDHVHSRSRTHDNLSTLGVEEQAEEICGMADVLDETYGDTGHVGSLARAPYGASDAATREAAGSCGIDHLLHWSVVAEDGELAY